MSAETFCPSSPFWHDCDRLPCADCPSRICEGGCGFMATECECEAGEEYDYCCECHLAPCACDPAAEFPPPPGQDLAYELAKR